MRDPLFRNDSSHRVAVMQYGQPVTGRELAHGESGRGDGLVIDTNLNQAFDPADTYFKLSNASVAALPGQSLRVVDTETGPALWGAPIDVAYMRHHSMSVEALSTAYNTRTPKTITIDGQVIYTPPDTP